MTQPATQQQDGGGQVIAAAVIGLALIAIEGKVRQDVEDTIAALYKGLAATALLAAATAGTTVLTGLALISLPLFHNAMTHMVNAARLTVRAHIQAAYTAAAQTAAQHVDDWLGHTAGKLPDLGTTDTLLRDVDAMFGHAQTAFQNTVATSYDPRDPDRLVKLQAAANAAQARLRQRATAAATTAVHRAATDTEQSIFSDYQNTTGIPGLMKRWRTTSANPCGMCSALDGTLAGINGEFDHNATTDDKDLRPVWRSLAGPPRHPNCRCQIELVVT